MISKQDLLDFISKYSLDGVIQTVRWECTPSKLSVMAWTDDRHVYTHVELSNINTWLNDNCVYGVYDTSLFKQMLSALSEIKTMSDVYHNNIPVAFTVQDVDDVVVTYALADQSIIPVVPLIKEPPFTLSFELSRELIDKFLRSKSALSSETTFKLDTIKNTLSFVIGSTTGNSNKIVIPITPCKEQISLKLNIGYFRNILTINKSASTIQMDVTNNGLLKISSTERNYKANYYLAHITI
jgi:hypothetical protein